MQMSIESVSYSGGCIKLKEISFLHTDVQVKVQMMALFAQIDMHWSCDCQRTDLHLGRQKVVLGPGVRSAFMEES